MALVAAGYGIVRVARRIPRAALVRPRPGRGRIMAFSAAVPALGLLMSAGYTYRERIFEEWYLHRLGFPQETVRRNAVEMLGRFGSARSVAALTALVEREGIRSSLGLKAAQALLRLGRPGLDAFWDDDRGLGTLTLYAVVDASDDDLKDTLVPPALEALKDPDFLVRFEGASLLRRLGAPAEGAIPDLTRAAEDENETGIVRTTASDAVLRIEGSFPAKARRIPATSSPSDPATRS
jgi:HEAT repeat protein